jgi:signal transduction histidine kinase
MLDLVNELLDLATIEAGELKLALESQDLAALLEKSVFLNNIEAAKKGSKVTLAKQVALVRPKIDSAKIRQVADNLISNAIKFSPPGSEITVEINVGEDACGFSVKDQGPGIPAAERDKLFKDFGKLSVKPTAGEKSTGLGLAICRKIVDAHRGSILAENLPTRGCEFRVTLPTTP